MCNMCTHGCCSLKERYGAKTKLSNFEEVDVPLNDDDEGEIIEVRTQAEAGTYTIAEVQIWDDDMVDHSDDELSSGGDSFKGSYQF